MSATPEQQRRLRSALTLP